MPISSYTITCLHKTLIAPGVFELHFEKPENFVFKAGQFILFDVPLPDQPSDIQTRAYSIASAPHEQDLIFVIKLVPGGRASTWIESVVDRGSQVIMKGPFGRFTISSDDKRRLLLVGTGTGIAPFRSHLLTLLAKEKSARDIHLVFGVCNEEDLFWMDTLSSLAIEYPQFHFHPTLTGQAPSWKGQRGRVYEAAQRVISNFSNMELYLCGAPVMVQSVKDKALKEWGMDKKAVHVEGFI